MVVLICLVIALGCAGSLVFIDTNFAAAVDQSGYTQAHGLLRSGTVTSVTNHQTKSPSSDLGVRLDQPVDGQVTTTAHVSPITSLTPGATVRVLVDPQNPSYAEFPGQRYIQQSSLDVATIALAVCLAFFVLTAAWWGRVWYRQRRRGKDADGQPIL